MPPIKRKAKKSIERYTPRSIFDALGFTFDLDPCHPVGEPLPWVPARRVLTKREDGLATPWPPGALVWCNPPYGREIGPWIEKMARHRNGIALVFARTGSGWYQDHLMTADMICYVRKRIHFVDRDGVSPGPAEADSVLAAWGYDAVRALERCGLGRLGRMLP